MFIERIISDEHSLETFRYCCTRGYGGREVGAVVEDDRMQASTLRTTVFQLDDEEADQMQREAAIEISDDDDDVPVVAQPKSMKRKREDDEVEEGEAEVEIDDDDDDEDGLVDSRLWAEIAARESQGPQLGLVRGIGGGGGVGQPGTLTTMQVNSASSERNRKSARTNQHSSAGTPAPSNTSRYFLPRKELLCFRCNKPGHFADSCPMDNSSHINCYICARKGHHGQDCPNNDSTGARSCFWCGSSEHHFQVCQYFSAVISHNDTSCMICGRKGHATCAPYSQSALSSSPFCCNCGERDHTHVECNLPNCSRLLHPALYAGKTSSVKSLDRCAKCGQYAHNKSQCDNYRRYILDQPVSGMPSNDRPGNSRSRDHSRNEDRGGTSRSGSGNARKRNYDRRRR
jgi:hypothetical protein